MNKLSQLSNPPFPEFPSEADPAFGWILIEQRLPSVGLGISTRVEIPNLFLKLDAR